LGLAAYAVPAKPLSSFVIQLSQMFFPLNTIKGGAFSPDAETADRIVVFSRPGPLVVLELGLPLAPTIFVLLNLIFFLNFNYSLLAQQLYKTTLYRTQIHKKKA
jgi:hypothetical protein